MCQMDNRVYWGTTASTGAVPFSLPLHCHLLHIIQSAKTQQRTPVDEHGCVTSGSVLSLCLFPQFLYQVHRETAISLKSNHEDREGNMCESLHVVPGGTKWSKDVAFIIVATFGCAKHRDTLVFRISSVIDLPA